MILLLSIQLFSYVHLHDMNLSSCLSVVPNHGILWENPDQKEALHDLRDSLMLASNFFSNISLYFLLQNSCIPPTLVGAAAAPTFDPFHLNSNTLSTLAPTHSPVSEDVQMAMAIDASIQSAMAEGVMRLEQLQLEDSKGSSSKSTSRSCAICLDAQVEGACVPCGHMAGCMTCLNKIKRKNWGCPVCRAKIDQVVRIYAV